MTNKIEFKTTVKVYESLNQLSKADQILLKKAEEASALSYSPYSKFPVGTAFQLDDGTYILGSNQEDAAFPAGICAERVGLSNLAMQKPGTPIYTIAIVVPSDAPAAPCGICRQSLFQQEFRQNQNIRLLLKGKSEEIYLLPSVKSLLPLPFTF
ncbi:MAG: cytidine deaminase [Chitinophagales bacterium]